MNATPPQPPRAPVERELHGDVVVDEYAWMRERGDDVIAHLEAENEYTRARLEHTQQRRSQIFEEIKGRVKETDRSVATQKDAWWYWVETEQDLQYRRYCRSQNEPDPDPDIATDGTVILDANALAGDSPYFALGAFEVSPDHRLLAYSVDFDGGEQYTMRFRDLETRDDLDDEIPGTYYGTAWALDNETLYYVVPDDAMRPYQVRRHRLGTPAGDDEIVYAEEDERFFVSVDRTRSDAYIVISAGSKLSDEVHLLDAADPHATPRVVWPRRAEIEYSVDHHPDCLYIVTNENAPNGKLVTVPFNDPSLLTEVIAHRDAVKIEAVEAFARHFVVWGRKDGLTAATVVPLDARPESDLSFADTAYTIAPAQNPTFDTDRLRFVYTSLVTPTTVFEQDVVTGKRVTKKIEPVLGGYDPSAYETAREWATAPDGTDIPISIVGPAGATGPTPLLLYGYGSYEASIDPSFSSARLSLLERGFTFAIAHVRGGGELGRRWYEGGKLMNKANTFTDFIACAEHLIDTGRTSAARLAMRGGSAGGLLIGAVVNMRPDLCAAAVAEVPFVDVINTMLDESLPLTVTEWEEWGNPADAPTYAYMREYAPYENVGIQAYPAVLITAGLNDPRVQYWEPAKWAARLRNATTGDAPILLKCELDAGHAGPSGRYDIWKDEALVYAFVVDALDAAT